MKKKVCPVVTLLSLLGKKWNVFLIKSLYENHATFTDIKNSLTWISANILTERLTELIEAWYIEKKVVSVTPLKITYGLTKNGKQLGEKIDELSDRAKSH